jgi:hypothetical protein
LQLRLTIAALLVATTPVAADNRFDFATSYFIEPSQQLPIHVIHPGVDISGDATRWLTLRAGYDIDIVTGSTPRIYGSTPDAISSATHFSDYRHSAHGGAEVRIGPTALDANFTYGRENDYQSYALDVGARVDLWGKNTTFRLAYSHNWDATCNVDNGGASPVERRALTSSNGCFTKTAGLISDPLSIDSYYAGWTQVLAPWALSDLGVSFQVLDGFQSNPYRLVRLFSGTVEAQESSPKLRERVAVQGRLRFMIKNVKAALGILGRYYWDTWAINSGTLELTWDQYLSQRLILRLRGRFYQQGRALFYRDAKETNGNTYETVGPVGQYFTGDRELSPFRNWLLGAKISWQKSADELGKVAKYLQAVDLSLKMDLIWYEALTPLPPASLRLQTPIQAVVLQIGITLHW